MSESSEYLQVRTLKYGPQDVRKGCFVWCPGCAAAHMFTVETPGPGPVWGWDGNLEKPTFTPSYLTRGGNPDTRCHSFLRNGVWEFLPDSTHQLAGQRVEMVPLPAWLRKETTP